MEGRGRRLGFVERMSRDGVRRGQKLDFRGPARSPLRKWLAEAKQLPWAAVGCVGCRGLHGLRGLRVRGKFGGLASKPGLAAVPRWNLPSFD